MTISELINELHGALNLRIQLDQEWQLSTYTSQDSELREGTSAGTGVGMTISELMAKLAQIKVEHGDIGVWIETREEDWEAQSVVVVERPKQSYVLLRTIV